MLLAILQRGIIVFLAYLFAFLNETLKIGSTVKRKNFVRKVL